jgi:hypothetical protein
MKRTLIKKLRSVFVYRKIPMVFDRIVMGKETSEIGKFLYIKNAVG